MTQKEIRKDGQLAREYDIALQIELSKEQNITLLEEIVNDKIIRTDIDEFSSIAKVKIILVVLYVGCKLLTFFTILVSQAVGGLVSGGITGEEK